MQKTKSTRFSSFITLLASCSPLSVISPAQSPVPLYLVGHQKEGPPIGAWSYLRSLPLKGK